MSHPVAVRELSDGSRRDGQVEPGPGRLAPRLVTHAAPAKPRALSGLYLIASGRFNATACAAHIGRQDETVLGWAHRYNEHGPDALTYRRTGGRAPLLTGSNRSRSLTSPRTVAPPS